MISSDSLAVTLDGVNQAFFGNDSISKVRLEETAEWIASRQCKSGRSTGMFTPTEHDYQQGVRLFTGEHLKTKLATRNILTAEAAKALVLLGFEGQDILRRADRWLSEQCFAGSCVIGECAHSTVGLVRCLVVSGLDDSERRLAAHVKVLSQHRDGKGRWRRFPFYYTVLALTEFDLPVAVEELRYAAPACEMALMRSSKDEKYAFRRRVVLQNALAKS